MPDRALLNDVNPHLVNFYAWLKRGLRTSIEMENSESCFYLQGERFNELLRQRKQTTKEAASIFYYQNRTGYNGLCRFNRSGEFNVPFGRYKKINYTHDFSPYAESFSNWKFLNQDFEKVPLAKTDFVYADPPY